MTPERRKVVRRVMIWALAFSVLGGAIIALLPLVIEWQIEKILVAQGADTAAVGDVDFNPLTGRLTINYLAVSRSGRQTFSIDEIVLKVRLWGLLRKTLQVKSLELKGGSIIITQKEDGTFTVGGLPFWEGDPGGQPAEESPWEWESRSFNVSDFIVIYNGLDIYTEIDLNEGFIGFISSNRPEEISKFNADLLMEGGRVKLRGQGRPLSEKLSVSSSIKIDGMDAAWAAPLFNGLGVDSFGGTLDADGEAAVEFGRDWKLHAADVSGRVSLGNVEVVLNEPGIKTTHKELSLVGKVSYGDSGEYKAEIEGEVSEFTAEEMERTQYSLAVGKADLKMDVQGRIGGAESANTLIVNGSAQLSGIGAALADVGLDVRLEKGSWAGIFSSEEEGSVSGEFTAAAEGLQAEDTTVGRQVLSVEKASFEESALTGKDGLKVSGAILSGVGVLSRPAQDEGQKAGPSHVIAMKTLDLRNISISNGKNVAVQKVSVGGMEGLIERDEQGKADIVEWLENRGVIKSKKKKETPVEKFAIRVEQIEVGEGSGLVLKDQAVSPAVEMSLRPLEIRAGPLDNARPQQETKVFVSAGIGKYASFTLTGEARPFKEPPSVELTGKAEGIDVPELTAYLEDLIGYRATQGQLDMDMEVALNNNILDADMRILLVKLQMEPVEGKKELFSKLSDISFNKAVSLLRDKQGNLRLRITVKGDIKDPQFQVRDVMRQALGKAIRQGATSYFAPIGVTLLTGVTLPPGTMFLIKKLLGWATAVRFDPVEYGPMEFELTEDDRARLDKMAELLRERPDVQVAICGLSTLADLRELHRRDRGEADNEEAEEDQGEAGKVAQDEGIDRYFQDQKDREIDAEAKEEDITEEERQQLMALAVQRADGIKEYLVNEAGVDAKRLVLCTPELELDAKSPPRVEMGV